MVAHPGALRPVGIEDVLGDPVFFIPGEIDVDIGGVGAGLVEEALEIKVVGQVLQPLFVPLHGTWDVSSTALRAKEG